MSIKKEDRAFLAESLSGHIARTKVLLEDAVEQVCLAGAPEDTARMDALLIQYHLLLKANTLLTDHCA
jgi:hypothetical protein